MDLDDLLAAHRRGDPSAWGALGRTLFREVWPYHRRRFGAVEAGDLTQTTMLAVVRGLDRFEHRHPGSFRAWVFAIARSTASDFVRAGGRERVEDPAELAAADTSNTERIDRLEKLAMLTVAIDYLATPMRRAVQYYGLRGVRGDDLIAFAASEGVAPVTIRTRVHQALRILRLRLSPEGREVIRRRGRLKTALRPTGLATPT